MNKENKEVKNTTSKNEQIANVKANESILKNMLSNLDKSIFVSNSGQSKENIYKKDVFKDCITDIDKKRQRQKIRNLLDNFCKSFIAYKAQSNEKKLSELKKQFDVFYSTLYLKNDYSLESIISNNTDQNKKLNLQKMLSIIKEIKQ